MSTVAIVCPSLREVMPLYPEAKHGALKTQWPRAAVLGFHTSKGLVAVVGLAPVSDDEFEAMFACTKDVRPHLKTVMALIHAYLVSVREATGMGIYATIDHARGHKLAKLAGMHRAGPDRWEI